jgi:hypothetical protein
LVEFRELGFRIRIAICSFMNKSGSILPTITSSEKDFSFSTHRVFIPTKFTTHFTTYLTSPDFPVLPFLLVQCFLLSDLIHHPHLGYYPNFPLRREILPRRDQFRQTHQSPVNQIRQEVRLYIFSRFSLVCIYRQKAPHFHRQPFSHLWRVRRRLALAFMPRTGFTVPLHSLL